VRVLAALVATTFRAGDPMSDRRFTDDEVALILREASEAQAGRPGGSGEGLTLAQLKEIAAEVGLDPAQVEASAKRLIRRSSETRVPILGTAVSPEFEREIPGELDPGDVAELVTTIRRILGRRGISDAELGAFEWRARDPMGGRYVSVLARNGATRLRVFANFRDGLMGLGMGGGVVFTLLFSSLLTGLGLGDLVGVGVLPLGMLLSVLPVRGLWRWRYRKEERALADLTEALDEQIRGMVSGGGAGPAPDPEEPV